jgi:hypothetical protein
MSATQKQKNCILALSRDVGVKAPNKEQLEDLTFEQAAQMIDALRVFETNGQAKQEAQPQTKQTIDRVVFGLCFKLVYSTKGAWFVYSNEDQFRELVKAAYRIYKQLLAEMEDGGTLPAV